MNIVVELSTIARSCNMLLKHRCFRTASIREQILYYASFSASPANQEEGFTTWSSNTNTENASENIETEKGEVKNYLLFTSATYGLKIYGCFYRIV